MVLTVVEDAKQILALQQKFSKILESKSDGHFPMEVGNTKYPDDYSHTVYDFSKHGFWYAHHETPGAPYRRYVNVFGITEKNEREFDTEFFYKIICEINLPPSGNNWSVASAFVTDEAGKTYLVHSGKISGGKNAIGQSDFEKHFSGHGKWGFVKGTADPRKRVIIISELDDKQLVSNLADFVKQVHQIKTLTEGGNLPNNPSIQTENRTVTNKTQSSSRLSGDEKEFSVAKTGMKFEEFWALIQKSPSLTLETLKRKKPFKMSYDSSNDSVVVIPEHKKNPRKIYRNEFEKVWSVAEKILFNTLQKTIHKKNLNSAYHVAIIDHFVRDEIEKLSRTFEYITGKKYESDDTQTDEMEQSYLESIELNKTKDEIRKELRDVSPQTPQMIEVRGRKCKRDNKTIVQLKILRDFKCQICGHTFRQKNGKFYAEGAHIDKKSKFGPETSSNIMILCPNHHREFDLGNTEIIKRTMDEIIFKLNGIPHRIKLSL
ncbi:HNH endonuclease [Candidatus Nitrosotalea okcheonensis]|nr:HNH endonuclease [Candidatus Nitrosotalea okcheonensis]